MSGQSNRFAKPVPTYRCHKLVGALLIVSIVAARVSDGHPVGSKILSFEDFEETMMVDAGFIAKHEPVIGGYIVFYRDGYTSFSPKEAFEEGYSKVAPFESSKEEKLPTPKTPKAPKGQQAGKIEEAPETPVDIAQEAAPASEEKPGEPAA